MDNMKAALIQLIDGRYHAILTKYLRGIKNNKGFFNIKGSKKKLIAK